MANGWTLEDFDVCFCGDYRHQHKNGKGACLFNSPAGVGHHGGMKCNEFRLTYRLDEIPEPYASGNIPRRT